MDTWKKYLIVTVLLMSIVVALTLLAVNFQGWGTAVSSSTGPVTTGLYNIGANYLSFGLQSGYNMLLIIIVIPAIAIVISCYVTWHWDVGYMLSKNNASSSPASNYDNTMKREPEEPERSSVVSPTK